MPFMGANFQVAPDVVFDDRQLDVFVYSDLNKRDLIGQAMQSPASVPDARIQRYRAKTISITTDPAMPVMADGVLLGDGPVTVTLHPHRLRVMAGLASVATTAPTLAAVAGTIGMNPTAEVQAQQKLAHTTWGQRLLNRRTIWRMAIVLWLARRTGFVSRVAVPVGALYAHHRFDGASDF